MFGFAHMHLLGIFVTARTSDEKQCARQIHGTFINYYCLPDDTRPMFRLFEYAARVRFVLIYDSHCRCLRILQKEAYGIVQTTALCDYAVATFIFGLFGIRFMVPLEMIKQFKSCVT